MLTESFVAATLSANKPAQHLSSALKDVGIFLYELQPENALRQGFKRSSLQTQSLAVSRSHIFAAQDGKAVINVYNRQKGNQEATVPFPEKVTSVCYADGLEVLVLGTAEGKLILWEVGTGRIATSSAAHLQAIDHLGISSRNDAILSGSLDSTVHVWSISKLLSFQTGTDSYPATTSSNTPVATFSQHREGIAALGAGYSGKRTNLAFSASNDRICHIWHIESCETVRTVLLPSVPTCISIDPAERALYLGDAEGNVTNIDLLALGESSKQTTNSMPVPVQISEQEQWRQSSDATTVHAMALSYDGTALLTGHSDGSILRWDIAKRKVANEIARLGQPVTNLCILRPDGLRQAAQLAFSIPEVIKPKLEFNAQLDHGSSGIPASYKLHATLTGMKNNEQVSDQGVLGALTSNGWPNALLDDAVAALEAGIAAPQTNGSSSREGHSEKLEQELAELKKTVAAYQQVEMEKMEASLARMRKRGDIDLRRREVYHAAIKRGEDKKAANAAMKAFVEDSEAQLMALDAQDDAEAFQEPMDIS